MGLNISKDWTFKDESVADNFMDHVRGQLPFYDLVVESICKIARNFVKVGDCIYDIGSATGNLADKMQELVEDRDATYIALDNAEEILSKSILKQHKSYRFIHADALTYDFNSYDLCVINLALMFMHPSQRGNLITKLKKLCKPHGAFIVTEKMYPPNGFYSTVNNRLLWSWKLQSNPAEEVVEKELSLEGIQVPLSSNELEGFTEWFRFGDFASYIYINEDTQS